MVAYASLLCAALFAAEPPPAAPAGSPQESPQESSQEPNQRVGEAAEEPEGGVGVTPIELIPRIELRQTFRQLVDNVSTQDTTLEIDIQFMRRFLLGYQVPFRTADVRGDQTSGVGDLVIQMLAVITSNPRHLTGLILGVIPNTATQPQLGAGKQQILFGGGVALKPYRWWLPYGLVEQQISVAGSTTRQDVNQLLVRIGNVLFGKQYNWLKVDLDTTVDFVGGASGRFFGTLELGSLVIGRVGLFMRAGTQLLGERQLDYTLAGGARYLFRLERARLKP